MTPKQLEAAARKLCEIRGVDPDKQYTFTVANDPGPDGALSLSEESAFEWEYRAHEIRAYLEIQEAIQWTVRRSTCGQGNRLDLHRTRDGVYLACLPDCDAAWREPSPENLVIVNPPKSAGVCVCGHHLLSHADKPHCFALDCDCDMYTEDTGATIEANKTP